MIELKRLVRVVEMRAKKSLHNFIDLSQDSLEVRLYMLVQDNTIEDDAAAMEALYGKTTDAKGYKMLKSRLKKKLYAAADTIVLDDPLLKPYAYKEQKCLNLIHRAFIFTQLGEKVLALKVISQAIAIAEEFKIAPLLLRCYEMKYTLSFSQNDFNTFKQCEQEIEHYKKLKELELESKIIYYSTRFNLKQSVAGRKMHLEELPDIIQLLEKKWEASNDPQIFEYLHILKIQYNELIGSFQQIIYSADNAEKLVADGIIPPKRFDFRFNCFIKLFALLQLRRYEEGLVYARSLENTFIYGSNNWASYLDNYFLLALQSKNYDLAASLLEKLRDSGAVHLINSFAKEQWVLNISFFNLVSDSYISPEKILGEEAKDQLKQTVRDKQGFNVSVVILDIFDLLKQDDLEDTNLYSDRIRKYVSKYLNKPEAERPRLFLKLLLLMFRENLDVVACRTKGKYLLQKLRNAPMPGNAFAEVEIVPYEQLWELALNLLAKSGRKPVYS